jgi:hypothetical protein
VLLVPIKAAFFVSVTAQRSSLDEGFLTRRRPQRELQVEGRRSIYWSDRCFQSIVALPTVKLTRRAV